MKTTRITKTAIVTCLGRGRDAHIEAMRTGRSGLAPATITDLPFDCFTGAVQGLDDLDFPGAHKDFDNRANRLALAALQSDGIIAEIERLKSCFGAQRIGIAIGTSTAGIEMLETVYRARSQDAPMPSDYSMRHHDNVMAVAAFLQDFLSLQGPAHTVSTACSSSAKSLIDAVQLIEAGICDAVLTGGVDCLCLTSLNGFESLELVSRAPCKPCDASRDGLTIAEAAALMIVERDAEHGFRLLGFGESSDGISMSTPPADGAGALDAMRQALARAELTPADIDYINLHGTATPINDAAETVAVHRLFGAHVPASSLKGAVGHTLGAAGAVETVLCLLAMEAGFVPGNTGLETFDPAILCRIQAKSEPANLACVMSNAFGFGGSNCTLVLGR